MASLKAQLETSTRKKKSLKNSYFETRKYNFPLGTLDRLLVLLGHQLSYFQEEENNLN